MWQAIDGYEQGPQALETAATREDAALLVDETEAVEQLLAALEAYEAAGATADATRVRASLRRRGVRLGVRGARQRPATGWDSLTPPSNGSPPLPPKVSPAARSATGSTCPPSPSAATSGTSTRSSASTPASSSRPRRGTTIAPTSG